MGLFRTIRKGGIEIELPASGSELREEMVKVADRDEFRHQRASLIEGNSSKLVRAVLTDNGVTWAEAKRALNPEVLTRTIENIFTNTNTKPLFPIITEEYIRNGYEKAGRANELLMGTVPMEQKTQEFYYYEDSTDNKDSELDFNLIAQGAPIPVMTVKLQDKRNVRVYKRGGGVEFTDEAKSMKIDMLAAFLKRRGQRLGKTDEALAMNSLLNGYFDDGWDAPQVIGVKQTGGISITDMWYAHQFMEQETGFEPKRIIMNLATSEEWVSAMTKAGNPLFLDELKSGSLPNVITSKPMISNSLPDGQAMLVDTDFALQEYLFKPFSTEIDRNVKTQVEGSYTTKTGDYVPFERKARMLIDFNTAR